MIGSAGVGASLGVFHSQAPSGDSGSCRAMHWWLKHLNSEPCAPMGKNNPSQGAPMGDACAHRELKNLINAGTVLSL